MKVLAKKQRWPYIEQQRLPRHVRDSLQPGTRAFLFGRMSIFLSRYYNPESGEWDGHWHLSIDGKTRYPTWDELVAIRYALIPSDVTMAMALPPLDQYVNYNEYVFQMTEVPNEWIFGEGDRLPHQGAPRMLPTALRDYRVPVVRWLNGGMETSAW